MIIKLLQEGQIAAEIDLDQGERIIGRDESCKVQLDDPSVSPVHAKLYADNGRAFLSDLGSEGGTIVNSAKIDAPVQLADGDSLQIGDFIFIAQIVGADTPATEPVSQEQAGPSEDTAASSAKSMGKGLMNLAKASAREAGRGARLASLKTQMEKLKHVDLSSAYAELGARAYELKLFGDICGSLYSEIDNLDQSIATKREGVAAADDAGFAGKAKAKALSIKGKAEAEALSLKRKGKFAEIGKIVYEQNPDSEALKPLLDAVAAIKERIEKLSSEYDSAAADSEGRDAFMSSAKDIGVNAKSVATSHYLRKPKVWVIAGLLITGIVYGLYRVSDRPDKKNDTLSPEEAETAGIYFVGYELGVKFSPFTSNGKPAEYSDLVVVMKQMGIDLTQINEGDEQNAQVFEWGFRRGLLDARKGKLLPGYSLPPKMQTQSSNFEDGRSILERRNDWLPFVQKDTPQQAGQQTARWPQTDNRAREQALSAEIKALSSEVNSLQRVSTLGMSSEQARNHVNLLQAKQQMLQLKNNELIQLRNAR